VLAQVGKHSDALRMALKLGSRELAEEAFAACGEPIHKKQLAYILGRHGLVLNLEEGPAAVEDEELREQLQQIIRWVPGTCVHAGPDGCGDASAGGWPAMC
jgi:26S proteasome regulatory subunit N1